MHQADKLDLAGHILAVRKLLGCRRHLHIAVAVAADCHTAHLKSRTLPGRHKSPSLILPEEVESGNILAVVVVAVVAATAAAVEGNLDHPVLLDLSHHSHRSDTRQPAAAAGTRTFDLGDIHIVQTLVNMQEVGELHWERIRVRVVADIGIGPAVAVGMGPNTVPQREEDSIPAEVGNSLDR